MKYIIRTVYVNDSRRPMARRACSPMPSRSRCCSPLSAPSRAVKRPWRSLAFPYENQFNFVWGFCMGAQGAEPPKTAVFGPGRRWAASPGYASSGSTAGTSTTLSAPSRGGYATLAFLSVSHSK
jgi:hypothetical protein